mgnify:CR=1 FL=1
MKKTCLAIAGMCLLMGSAYADGDQNAANRVITFVPNVPVKAFELTVNGQYNTEPSPTNFPSAPFDFPQKSYGERYLGAHSTDGQFGNLMIQTDKGICKLPLPNDFYSLKNGLPTDCQGIIVGLVVARNGDPYDPKIHEGSDSNLTLSFQIGQ